MAKEQLPTNSATKEQLITNSATKEPLRSMSARGAVFGVAVFGTATFGGSSNQYTKQALVNLIPTT